VNRKTAPFRLLIVIGIIFIFKSYILDVRRISGYSMEPTLSNGQIVVIWKLAYGIPSPWANRYLYRWRMPQEGDIVLYAIDGRYVIKRCAGAEGADLNFILNPHGILEDGQAADYAVLQLNKRTVPLNQVQLKNLGGFLPQSDRKVPTGFILALGDNAAQSRDSRDYGFVAADSICGALLWN
jgi:signal peptidase I